MKQHYNTHNDEIKIFVGGSLLPRHEAKISVFDSSVQGGDAVWEGLRIYNNTIFCFHEHINRLHASAKTLMFSGIPSKEYIKNAIVQTLQANNMHTDVHIRLTLTRGEKITSGMDPRLNEKGCCLIVLAEFKPPVYDNQTGIRLITSSIRRNSPMHLDSKIHHNNLLNNILAKIEANHAQADDALMLDNAGFVSETNACNIFMGKNGVLYTPLDDACLPGITRSLVINLAEKLHIKMIEKNLSVSEFYNADEIFTTGTMGELTPVIEIDRRKIENIFQSNLHEKIYAAFQKLTEEKGEPF